MFEEEKVFAGYGLLRCFNVMRVCSEKVNLYQEVPTDMQIADAPELNDAYTVHTMWTYQ